MNNPTTGEINIASIYCNLICVMIIIIKCLYQLFSKNVNNQTAYKLPSKGLKVMHLNIQHLYPHFSEVLIMLSQMKNKPDVLGFSETFLQSNR
jgi:hypothetical protein